MNQSKIYDIKRIIGKICIGIVFLVILILISGFILEAGYSIIQTLVFVVGVGLFIIICCLAVNWGDL